jgi:hypothetical protein
MSEIESFELSKIIEVVEEIASNDGGGLPILSIIYSLTLEIKSLKQEILEVSQVASSKKKESK